MRRTLFRICEALIVGVALVVLTVRYAASDAYQEYRRTGGRNGFWSWFAKEKCGVSLPGVEDQDAQATAEEKRVRDKTERKRKAALARLEARKKERAAAEAREMKRQEAARKKLAEEQRKKSARGSTKGKGRSFAGSSGKVRPAESPVTARALPDRCTA